MRRFGAVDCRRSPTRRASARCSCQLALCTNGADLRRRDDPEHPAALSLAPVSVRIDRGRSGPALPSRARSSWSAERSGSSSRGGRASRCSSTASVRAQRCNSSERGSWTRPRFRSGDIVATKADPQLGSAVRERTLLGLDLVEFNPIDYRLRSAYRDTADRGDYEQLVSELRGASAYGFLGGEKPDPARFRRALDEIPTLPRRAIRLFVPTEPALRAGARLLYAQWRDVGPGSPARYRSPRRCERRARARRLSAGGSDSGGARPAQRVGAARCVAARTRRDTATQRSRARRRTALDFGASRARSRGSSTLASSLRDWRVGGRTCSGDVDYSAIRSRASSRRP